MDYKPHLITNTITDNNNNDDEQKEILNQNLKK
jgi:hypothetical protein